MHVIVTTAPGGPDELRKERCGAAHPACRTRLTTTCPPPGKIIIAVRHRAAAGGSAP